MTYFKTGLGLTAAQRLGAPKASIERWKEITSGVATPEAIRFAKTKAEWPRCTVKVTDHRTTPPTVRQEPGGYMWKFKDGSVKCTPAWDQNFYSMVVLGKLPPIPVPDLSKVVRGSREYFEWLCKAQGTVPGDKGVQEVRIGFDRVGWPWTPTARDGKHWSGYPTAPKPRVTNIGACATYVGGSSGPRPQHADHAGANSSWKGRAYQYSVEHAENPHDHRTPREEGGGSDPKSCEGKVAPELVAACKAALAKDDGTTIDSFNDQVDDMSENELLDLIDGGPAAGAALPQPPQSGIPPLYLYGGAVAVVGLFAFLTLGKK
jgi:hypothetical protein